MIISNIEKHLPGNHSRIIVVREHIAKICEDFIDSGLADPKFLSELVSDSKYKFWSCVSEALVAERLHGFDFGKRQDFGIPLGAGPDFLLIRGSQKIWVEVICPEPTLIPSNWLKPKPCAVFDFPHQAILLRWTHAIKEKTEKLIGSGDGKVKGYINTGLVQPNDIYVVAVNACHFRNGPVSAFYGISKLPYAVEAVFSVGPLELEIDAGTQKIVSSSHQHRTFILNKNEAMIPTNNFLDPRYDQISAIWALDLNGGLSANNEPTAIIYNPNSKNPLPANFLPADEEYTAELFDEKIILKQSFR